MNGQHSARRLPGGVYAQWFHLYEVDRATVELVLRTYASVFDHVSVWYAHRADLLLLGFDRPDRALDVEALAVRFEREDFAAGFARCGIENFPALLALELLPLGTVNAAELQGSIHTLRDPILSDMARGRSSLGCARDFPSSPLRPALALDSRTRRSVATRGS